MFSRMLRGLFGQDEPGARSTSVRHQRRRIPVRVESLEDRCLLSCTPPVAFDDGASVTAEETLTVPAAGVLANDVPGMPAGDMTPCGNLSAVLVQGPSAGTLTLNGDGSFTYVAPDFVTDDTFTYKAVDNFNASNVATVTINVLKKAGQVRFVQERGIPVPASGTAAAVGTWSQPANTTTTTYGTGGFYGSNSGALAADGHNWASTWQTPPAWGESWVELTNPGFGGNVCNSNVNPSPDTGNSGTLTAWLQGTKGASYTVTGYVNVNVTSFGGVTATAGITDFGGGTFNTMGTVNSVGGGNNFYQNFTITVKVSMTGDGTKKLVEIVPNLCGLTAGVADFTGEIYITSVA